MIPVVNSYRLVENLPNAWTLTLPGRWTRIAVPVSRLVRASRSRVPFDHVRIGGLLTPHTKDIFYADESPAMEQLPGWMKRGWLRGPAPRVEAEA